MRFFLLLFIPSFLFSTVSLGIDQFFQKEPPLNFRKKRIALVINQTSKNSEGKSTIDLFLEDPRFHVSVLFCPEHGLRGSHHAAELIDHGNHRGITLFSLHGTQRRPTKEILDKIDIIIYDIQSIGTRSYTYESTLYYLMEEAAKYQKEIIVLDRPNPMGGLVVDGPTLDEKYRSFIGYIKIPYCHGMTIGELATLFNAEYQIGCKLTIIPMEGWKRGMEYAKTGLAWIPPSPNIPEPDTPFYYATTGILGELKAVNIGVGYTLPFKIIGAPWLKSKVFADHCNAQKLPGVTFHPFHFKPFFGQYQKEFCEGIYIQVTDGNQYKPVTVQYLFLGLFKSLYPTQFKKWIQGAEKTLFFKAAGNEKILQLLKEENYPFWKIKQSIEKDVKAFLPIRKKYLLYN